MPVAGVADETFIENSASIYFDYNEPVKTNTVLGRIELSTGIEDIISTTLSVFPNPSSNFTTVQLHQYFDDFDLEVLDLSGKIILTKKNLTGNQAEVNTAGLQNGIYIIRAESGEKMISMGKLVVLSKISITLPVFLTATVFPSGIFAPGFALLKVLYVFYHRH